ncbi:hypothetical protein BGZ99_006021 [Dissophora globulifera]|uniref:Uncharacterized protein n=1 Tax=Dissophora globulifera TaxID=979702 RepID=A0A9P6RZH5_9FUNG|nr:hypothetical protein BGZ99_005974 [Dissophora globulifera]KAG0330328.1 hypothetical protein BGZ99_006021 [Dissophora globulifera]
MGPNNSTFLVTRKLLGQTTLSKYANPDCATLATPALETVCNEILSLSYLGQLDRVYSIQLMTSNPQKAAVQWTIVSTYWAIDPDNGAPPPIPFPGYSLVMETMSLDIAVLAYPTALDAAQQIFIQNNDTRFATSGQEVFETTNFVPAWVDTADKSWANFGFTDDDLRNLTRFILAGTLLNSGIIIVRNPSLLADVPTMVVGLSFGLSLFMGALALTVSWNVAPMVSRPITEVLAEIAASKKNHKDGDEDYVKNGKKEIRSFPSFHRHRVANLTLALLKDTEQSNAEIISLNGTHNRIDDTLGKRTMNPEHRSKKEKKMFLRMDLDNDYENDDNNNDGSSNSDDTMKLLDINL